MSDIAPAPRKSRAGLGRGLSSLLGDIGGSHSAEGAGGQPAGVRLLSVTALAPHPDQPRRHFDETALDELAASIAARGMIQPIVVRPHGKEYQIVAGERRWRAAQRARLHEVPVIVRDLSDTETVELALVENIQRQDLNALEEADTYQKLIGEYGHTQEALAKLVGKSRSHVANLLRLLDLPVGVKQMLLESRISMGHARALINAPDPEGIADRVVARGLSVRDTEKLARAAKPQSPGSERVARGGGGEEESDEGDADIRALERQLGDVLGLPIRIAHAAESGTITIQYATLGQLDMVCQRLTGEVI